MSKVNKTASILLCKHPTSNYYLQRHFTNTFFFSNTESHQLVREVAYIDP